MSRAATRSARADLRADLDRYPPRPWFREQSCWALAVYRFGRFIDAEPGWRGWIGHRVYWFAFRVVEMATGISISTDVEVGPGLRIHHFGGIFVASGVRIGAGCTLRQGVTIGNRVDGGPVPVLGDQVELGAYAQVLGGVRIGDGCRIGALSVVLDDVPDGATAVGAPARVIERAASSS
jgi:serine O-acetyltransferase